MTILKRTRSRWFRFSLRTFFVLLTIFGISLGVQAKWIRDRHEMLERQPAVIMVITGLEAPAPGILWLFGEQGVGRVLILAHGPESSELARRAKQLFPEAILMCRALDAG